MATTRATQTVRINNNMSTSISLHLAWADGTASTAPFQGHESETLVYRTGDYGSPIKCIGIYVSSTQKSWSQCVGDTAAVTITVQPDGTITATHS